MGSSFEQLSLKEISVYKIYLIEILAKMNNILGYGKESERGRSWVFPTLLIGHTFFSKLHILKKIVLATFLVDLFICASCLYVARCLLRVHIGLLNVRGRVPTPDRRLQVCYDFNTHTCSTEVVL